MRRDRLGLLLIMGYGVILFSVKWYVAIDTTRKVVFFFLFNLLLFYYYVFL